MAVARAYRAAREDSHGELLTVVLEESPASEVAKREQSAPFHRKRAPR